MGEGSHDTDEGTSGHENEAHCGKENLIDCAKDEMPEKLTALREAIDAKGVKKEGASVKELELTPKVIDHLRTVVEKLEDAAVQLENGHRGPWSQFLSIGS